MGYGIEVQISRRELLGRLKANRDNHRSIFLEAQEKYREMVIDELDKMLSEARSGKEIRRAVTLIEPKDFTKEYDAVIDMIEMAEDDYVTIGDEDFRRYMRDEWEWKQQFSVANSSYTARAR